MAMDRDVKAPGTPRARREPRSPSREASDHQRLLGDAITALTAAARLTGTERRTDGSVRSRPCDWAGFVTLSLAGAAANIGGIELVLAGRPGSWEADAVRSLLTATVGDDEQRLFEHRTEPVIININVDDIMVDLGAWQAYDDAQDALLRRYDDLDLPRVTASGKSAPDVLARLATATPEQEHGCEQIAELEDRLEQQRIQDWVVYGTALRTHIQAQVTRLEGMPVLVLVNVDPETGADQIGTWGSGTGDSLAERLLNTAVETILLPGRGRSPLDRLEKGH